MYDILASFGKTDCITSAKPQAYNNYNYCLSLANVITLIITRVVMTTRWQRC